MLVYNPKLLNKSMDANRRQLTPLDAAGKFGAVVHDPTWVSAGDRTSYQRDTFYTWVVPPRVARAEMNMPM